MAAFNPPFFVAGSGRGVDTTGAGEGCRSCVQNGLSLDSLHASAAPARYQPGASSSAKCSALLPVLLKQNWNFGHVAKFWKSTMNVGTQLPKLAQNFRTDDAEIICT